MRESDQESTAWRRLRLGFFAGETVCMMSQKLERTLGIRRKGSDLEIGWREIIRSWSYEMFVEAKVWRAWVPCQRFYQLEAGDLLPWSGWELWARATGKVGKSRLYSLIQFVSSRLLLNPKLLLLASLWPSMLPGPVSNVGTHPAWYESIIWQSSSLYPP